MMCHKRIFPSKLSHKSPNFPGGCAPSTPARGGSLRSLSPQTCAPQMHVYKMIGATHLIWQVADKNALVRPLALVTASWAIMGIHYSRSRYELGGNCVINIGLKNIVMLDDVVTSTQSTALVLESANNKLDEEADLVNTGDASRHDLSKRKGRVLGSTR